MKNIILAGISLALLSGGLVGCNTISNTGNAVVGTGTRVVHGVGHATVNTVNAGAGVVTGVGRATVRTVDTGVNVLTSPFRPSKRYYHHNR